MPIRDFLRRIRTMLLSRLRGLALILAMGFPADSAAQTLAITSPTEGARITDTTPLFSGTPAPNQSFVLRGERTSGTVTLLTLTADASGNWSYDFRSASPRGRLPRRFMSRPLAMVTGSTSLSSALHPLSRPSILSARLYEMSPL